MVIDEPERHLHRSIIAPLLCQLFEHRTDCGFVISTHDHDLPLVHPDARTLLLRSVEFDGTNIRCWEADELSPGMLVDDDLKRDLLGARRKILFVEGTASSLDKSLYSILFPMVSVIPKGNCSAVEDAVVGARSAEMLHWLDAFGIVDSDGLHNEQIAQKQERGIYAVPYYSVEAVYFHPTVMVRVASRVTSVHGGDAQRLMRDAIAAGVAMIQGDTERLSQKVAKKLIHRSIMERIPDDDALLHGGDDTIVIPNESNVIHAACRQALDAAVDDGDWERILTACPIRESRALDQVSRRLRFAHRRDYERAVRHLLSEDEVAREELRNLFGDLAAQLAA